MSAIPDAAAAPAPPPYDESQPVPGTAWALAWSYLVGQLLLVARHGLRSDEAWPGSALLGVVVVTFFAHGVLRARRVRFWVVVVLTVLAALAQLWTLVDRPSAWAVVELALTVLQGWLLLTYRRSAWFTWQRTRPRGGPSLKPILAVAVLVGVLAGAVDAPPGAVHADLRIGVG
jgi:hypothetical protein